MFFTYLYNLLHKIFTFANICKVFIISFVGFLSRALVNHTWDINVFVEFTDPISLLYYLFFSIFIVWLHSFSSLFESYATSFPNIVELFNSLFRLFNINIKSIPNINLDALKLSSIRRALQSNYFFTKLPLTRPDTDTDIGTGTVEKKPLCSFNKHSDSARGSTKNSGGHGLRHRGGTRNLRDLSNSSDQTPRSSRPSRPAGPSGHRTVTQPVSSHISSRTRTLDQSHTYNNKPQTQPIPQRDHQSHSNHVYTGHSNNHVHSNNMNKHPVCNTSFTDGKKVCQDNVNTKLRSSIESRPNRTQNLRVTPEIPTRLTPEMPTRDTPISNKSLVFDGFAVDNGNLILKGNPNNVGAYPIPRNAPTTSSSVTPSFTDPHTSNLSNLSNVGVVGITDPSKGSVDYDMRRRIIADNVRETIKETVCDPYSSKEVVVPKKGFMGRMKLGFNYSNFNGKHNLHDIYVKYQDKGKRKLYWTIWEKRKDNYDSYQDFKNTWDPSTKIWKDIKKETNKDISREIGDLIRVTRPFETNEISSGKKGYINDNQIRKRAVSKKDISGPKLILP